MGEKGMLRAACCCSVVLVMMVAACSSDEEPAPVTPGIAKPTGHLPLTLDEIEAEMLAGLDESVPMTEQDLDTYFPVVEPLAQPEAWADRDPTKGDVLDVEKAFNAFTTAETADDHFTVEVVGTVAQADIDRAKKGVLFGMANWDAFRTHPTFNLTAASKVSAGGRAFKVTIRDTQNPQTGWRPAVYPCGGAPGPTNTTAEISAAVQNDTCVPRFVLPIEPLDPDTKKAPPNSLSPYIFTHEMAHIAQAYWQRSQPYLAAGGMKSAAAQFQEQNWALEADAQFTARHTPDASAYEVIFGDQTGCPFEPLRRGAFAWRNFQALGSGADADKLLGYKMSIFVEQLTWHRFGKDPAWLHQWLTTPPDPRMPGRPITPSRKLLKLISQGDTTTDQKTLNGVLVKTAADLYFKGLDPWTTRQLSHECIQPSASVALPLLAIDAVRVDAGDLSNAAKLRLSLDVSRDPDFIRAGVAAVAVDDAGRPKFIDCLTRQITENGLSSAEPRAGCKEHVTGLAVLSPKNGFKDEVQLPLTFKSGGKYAIVAIVAHTMKRKDAPNSPINVTLRAETVSTPPGNTIAKEQCGKLTEEYRSRCKTSNCFCIGNAYCEGTVDPPPASCEKMQQECHLFCAFHDQDCDCTSFCDLLYTRLACSSK